MNCTMLPMEIIGKIIPIGGYEELISKFKQFVLKIGYIGVFDIDFYESCGKMYFGELNLRIGGSMYAYTKMGVNLPGMLVKTLIGESIADMQKKISNTATYVNERMLLDDWYGGYVSKDCMLSFLNTSDIKFVYDNDDIGPQKELNRIIWITKFKKFVKRLIKK